MKKALGTVMFALIAAIGLSGSLVAHNDVTLDSAEAVFETTSNDKDHDSLVTVTVKKGNTVIAAANNIRGHFNNNSRHSFNLDVGGGWARAQLAHGTKTELSFSTNGNDKWEFNYILRLNWSDGTSTEMRRNGQVLTQDDTFRSYAVGL